MISTDSATMEDIDWEPAPEPDVSHLITEDDTPVDNQFSEKQMRLLTESLHASWNPGFPFVAMANVGVYVALNRAPIVPDVLVKTNVVTLQDLMKKGHRAYFSWQYDGKPPDVVIEIVSNTKGGELDTKHRNYEHMGVPWYAVLDPMRYLSDEPLTLFVLKDGKYRQQKAIGPLTGLNLGLVLWEGEYEGVTCTWLRWCDGEGNLILTGKERAAAEAKRADILADKLRELGINPDELT